MRGPSYTEEHIDFLRAHGLFMTFSQLTKAFNEAYGQNRSYFGIHGACITHNIKPWRIMSKNLAIGSEFVDACGYLVVKTAEPRSSGRRKWRHKHIVVWESAHGPVPKGGCIIFADGNKRNFALDNLVKVSRAEIGTLRALNLWSSDAGLTKTAINVVRLRAAIRDKEKAMNGTTSASA